MPNSTNPIDPLDEILVEYQGYDCCEAKECLSNELRLELKAKLNQLILETRKKTATEIFTLAHQYAQDDDTMIGSEELRDYHYYNAINKIGELHGR